MIPHGHRKTTTFLAGLIGSGFVAPYVLDDAMNGELFRAWTEQGSISCSDPLMRGPPYGACRLVQ